MQASLNYAFKRPELLRQALTHPSASEKHYQRLEFLGDAVLEMCISCMLFNMEPRLNEGEMTRRRALLVCEDALFAIADSLGLGQAILMDRNCEQSGGRRRKSIVSDALEAVLAAVYLDGGLTSAQAVIERLWSGRIRQDMPALDAKGALQAYLQGQGRAQPSYVLLSESGPMHKRLFEMAVLVEGRERGRAVSTSKKRAEQQAAETALSALQREEMKDEA